MRTFYLIDCPLYYFIEGVIDMPHTYNLVTVNSRYCDYLRQYDYRVSYNANEKELRPFVGVLFEIEDIKYFAPLSSPKQKHLKMKNNIDFYKIDGGKLGAINFNNMIPIPEKEYTYVDTNAISLTTTEKQYKELLKDQLRWLNRYGQALREKAQTLYNKRINQELPTKVANRCCDFSLLEEKYKDFIQIQIQNEEIEIENKRIQELLPKLSYIKDISDLYYIYERLNNQDNFENVARLLDNPENSKNISEMSKDEINDVLSRNLINDEVIKEDIN